MKLYLYDHSGLSISCQSFRGRAVHAEWDSGQVGYIYVLPAQGKSEWGKNWRSQARKCMEAETKTYDQYLNGDVYGFQILDQELNGLDDLWGNYGYDYCLEEAKREAERLAKEIKQKREAKLKAKIKHRVPLNKR